MRAGLLGVALGALLIVGSTDGASAPRLAFVSDEPVVVAGVGFRPFERVRLLVTPGPSTRNVEPADSAASA